MKKEMSKKGQFTIMVLLGLILLLILVFLFFMSGEAEVEQTTPDYPDDVQPIANFVESCLRDVGREAVMKLGQRGGYIEPRHHGIGYDQFTNPTNQRAVEVSPGSGIIVPYWHHMSSDNSCNVGCEFSSKMPQMYNTSNPASIPVQVSNHVEENINQCLQNFREFNQSFDIQVLATPQVVTSVDDGEVVLDMNFPLSVERDQETSTLQSFRIALDVDLKAAYDAAAALVENLAEDSYVEELALNILILNSFGEEPSIPPVAQGADVGRGLTPHIWTRRGTENRLSGEMARFADRVKLEGSANEEGLLTTISHENSFAAEMIIQNRFTPLQLYDYGDLEARFSYLPWWDSYVDITGDGADEEIIMSNPLSFDDIFAGFLIGSIMPQIKPMNYIYDWSFPTIFEFRDEDAFNGEGYTFRIAYEANIRNNEPMDSSFSSTVFGTRSSTTRVCDRSTWETSVINIETRNQITGLLEPDSYISYECGQETCSVGVTNEVGYLATRLPVCAGGVLKAGKERFLGTGEQLSTHLGMRDNVTVTLWPMRQVQAEVKKKQIARVRKDTYEANWPLAQPAVARNLAPDEIATLVLTRIPQQGDQPFSTVVQYDGSRVPMVLDMVPGVYVVQGTVIRNLSSPFTIPGMHRSGGFLGIGDYDLPPISIEDMIITGGVVIDENRPMYVTDQQLQRGKVIFYVANVPLNLIQYHEDLEALSAYSTVSQSNRVEFDPDYLQP